MNAEVRSEPYVVATRPLWNRMERSPLGVSIPEKFWFDPTRTGSQLFIDHLDQLDADTFGPLGMRMPRWALYDCAALPGAIIGMGEAIGDVIEPRSMCLLTPRLADDEWLAYSISSHPFDRALEVETLALAMAAVGARRVLATAQWSSQHLDVHARFGPLDLLAAWIPAHTSPRSFVYAFDVTRERLERARREETAPGPGATVVDAENEEQLKTLQARIEAGARISIVGVDHDGGVQRALVREVAP